jgi:hypothetical protein
MILFLPGFSYGKMPRGKIRITAKKWGEKQEIN